MLQWWLKCLRGQLTNPWALGQMKKNVTNKSCQVCFSAVMKNSPSLPKNCKNTTQVQYERILKISLHGWLNFECNNFFGSSHLSIFFSYLMDRNMARVKKVVIIKNQFFHGRQPCEGIFEILCCIFTIFGQRF